MFELDLNYVLFAEKKSRLIGLNIFHNILMLFSPIQLFSQYYCQNHDNHAAEQCLNRDSSAGRVALRLVGLPVADLIRLRFRFGDVGDVPLVAGVAVAETDLSDILALLGNGKTDNRANCHVI